MFVKKNIIKRAGLITLTACTMISSLCVFPKQIKAEEYWPEGPDIASPCAVVMEVNTGAVLYEKNSHEQHYPASITKILTTYLTLENCDLDEKVVFSEDAVYKNEGDTSHIWRDIGEEMTIEQCLYGVMLASANECAYEVAEYVGGKKGGDYSTFIDMMNDEVKRLGCTDTHFNNANGLPDEDHYTSAYDMALISCEAYKNEDFRIITGTETYTIPPTNKHDEPTYLSNHHNILHYYNTGKYINEYCTGGKTGYTVAANSTLVTYAEKDGITLCVVIMNAQAPDHYTDTNALIDYCFSNFNALSIEDNDTTVAENAMKDMGVLNSNDFFATLDKNAYIVLPSTVPFSDAAFELDQSASDSIAKLKYTYAGHEVGSVEIQASGAKVESEFYKDEPEAEKKVIKISPFIFVMIIILLIVLAALALAGKKIYDNFYVIRHNMSVKKERKDRFRNSVEKKKKYRKRDRMFK